MKLGFVGLGAMGFPMARHLAKEHDVVVWNRTREKAERHAREHGTTLANDLAEVADADAILTILPTSQEVDEIVDRLLPHLKEGTLWIDATSGDPNASRLTAKRLAEKGVAFVDAPVTGAVVGAENATLTIMMGGSEENVARAKEILRLNGKTLIHVGGVGAGHAIKVLTNSIMGATVWITSECLLLAKQLGIDIKTALEVTNAGSGRSNASENLLPMRLRDHQWPLVFKLAHHDKDIRIAASLAHQQHASTPLLALTSQLFSAALHELGDQADYIEVAKLVARMNGTSWD
ncbi:MAG: NAD(P)-dependent oxidoreductase [Acidobacteria bacterium]|nr:NAD(P)-dependent oxidoreductase [Acidobacteriota bacterium]MBV9476018.1 NAD(P)-dependent oxidoreductase [Acidobacteriota bacterium]